MTKPLPSPEQPMFFVRPSQLDQMRDPLHASWNRELAAREAAPAADFNLAELIDFSKMNEVFASYLEVIGLPVAIIDFNGVVLASSNWQRLCMEYHRSNENTLGRCLESDTSLSRQMQDGTNYAIYRCSNGLTDCASPIIVDGQHIANLFIGQFFLQPPDLAYFEAQCARFGFEREGYFRALAEVPIVAEERVAAILKMLVGFANLLARQSLAEHRARTAFRDVEQQVVERTQALARSEQRMRSIIELSPIPKALWTADGHTSYVNAAFVRSFGYTLAEVATADTFWERVIPEPQARAATVAAWRQRMEVSVAKGLPFQPTELTLTCQDGDVRTVIAEAVVIGDDAGHDDSRLTVFYDITQLKRAESALRASKERLEAAASAGIVGIWDWDVVNNRLVWDQVMYKLYGLREGDFGGAFEAWAASIHPDDRAYAEQEIQAALRGERAYAIEFRVLWPDGSTHYLKAVSQTTFDAHGKPLRMTGVNYDTTAQKEIQLQLDKLAYYDLLTGLPNRRLLEDRLQQAVALAQRKRRKVGVLFIDLDRFKPVNDRYGHEAGDWLLKQVAKRVKACLRASDTPSRLGGDEFVVLLPDVLGAQDAVSVAEKIRASLEQPFRMDDGKLLDISSSIGVALYPEHADDARKLLMCGDLAMYKAKQGGRNAVVASA
ncbi:diguanylate cyclase [Duganella sp. FT3S]|uniref:Diguanylate cyclase n=1 Tax=Rugamonas fusca TaxID=2758568 RepID=A0A7W2I787_9BURK|nr:diguanylate cyclase [Rugamonas fusca]MBA5606200.1 diguanylate cyclase [Rugamonas fusca]